MKKILLILIVVMLSVQNSYTQDLEEKPYSFEVAGGVKLPLGLSKDDIVEGLSLRVGMGYMLNKHFELAHLGFEFGSSSPHEPDIVVIKDWYDPYYGRLATEKVIVLGIPLTTRIHFTINSYFEAYVGGGCAYYWFSTRLEDQYYGKLQESRNRSGYGGIVQTGIFTNVFSDKFLIGLKFDLTILKTSGNTLSATHENDLGFEENRIDKYLSIFINMRYLFNK